jgi:ankyrin repeat protein
MTAMGYACKYGHIEVVEVLLEFKAKINFGSGIERFPPLNWASAYGHLKLV